MSLPDECKTFFANKKFVNQSGRIVLVLVMIAAQSLPHFTLDY